MLHSRRAELGHFLRTRRDRLTPEDVGLVAGSRRRARGLRREEVAVLANVSPTWYTYLEQGRDVRPSAEILDCLADALRLDPTERRYLHAIGAPPSWQVQLDISPVPAAIEAVSALMDASDALAYPVYAVDGRGNLVGWNAHMAEWYDDFTLREGPERNMVWWMFTSPVARERIADWEQDAREVAGRIRYFYGTSRIDREAAQGIAHLRANSEEFDRLWCTHDVVEQVARHRNFIHRTRGHCTLALTVLRLAICPSVTVVFHHSPSA